MTRFVGCLTWRQYLPAYFVLVVASVAGSIWAEERFGIDGERAILAEMALLFAVAATGRPRFLYLVVRNTGWFTAIETDRAMRGTLAVLAALLALGAAFHD